MTLNKNPEQAQVAEKSLEKKRTLMMTLNKDVSTIRLQQVKSHAEISPVRPEPKMSPKQIYAQNEDYDENEINEEVELHNLLKKMLNRSIDIKN